MIHTPGVMKNVLVESIVNSTVALCWYEFALDAWGPWAHAHLTWTVGNIINTDIQEKTPEIPWNSTEIA